VLAHILEWGDLDERHRTIEPDQISSQVNWMVCEEFCSGRRPRPIIPCPLSCRLSWRTNNSSPPAVCTKVPFVLRSTSMMNLLRLISMRACRRGDPVALRHDVIVLGTADGDARLAFIHQQLSVIKLQTQTHPACRARIARDPGHNDSSVCIRARAFALDYTEVLSTRYINPSPRIREST